MEREHVLESFKGVKNCVVCCNKDGLMSYFEKQQTLLEIYKKALANLWKANRASSRDSTSSRQQISSAFWPMATVLLKLAHGD